MNDVSTQTQADAVTIDDAADKSKASSEQATVDVPTQTGDFVVRGNKPSNASVLHSLSQARGTVVANDDSSESLAPEESIDENKTEVVAQTQEDTFADSSPSRDLALGATLVNTPTEMFSPASQEHDNGEEETQPKEDLSMMESFSPETVALMNQALNQTMFHRVDEDPAVTNGLEDSEQEESRSPDILPRAQNCGHSTSVEESKNAIQDAGENVAAVEASPMVPEELLRIEEAAHQQTLEELAELRDWCDRVQDENTAIQIQVEDTERENRRIQGRLNDAEDQSTTLQTQLSNTEGRIHELTSTSVTLIEGLQRQVVALNAEVSSYVQLGVNCYVRLQQIESLLNPFDRIFAAYQLLMVDAAEQFSTPVPQNLGTDSFSNERFVEIDENDYNEEEENDQKNNGMPILENYEVPRDLTAADAAQAEEYFTPLDDDDYVEDDDDDDLPFPGRPVRPGTANKTPISVFAAMPGDTPNKPSSSPFEDSVRQAQQDPTPATPTFPINFGFSEASVKPEEDREMIAVQEPIQEQVQEPVQDSAYDTKASSTSKGRTYGKRGQGRPGRATAHGKVPLRGGRDSGTSAGFGSPPAGTAFSLNYDFSEASVKAEDKHEATAAPIFGPQVPANSAFPSSPLTPESNFVGTVPKGEQKQGPAQKAGKTPKFGSDAFAKATASPSNSIDNFGVFSFNTANVSEELPNGCTPATEGILCPSLDLNHQDTPKATPQPQQNIYTFSMPTEHMEEDSSAKASRLKNNGDQSRVKLSSSKSKARPSGRSKRATTAVNLDFD